MKLRTRTMLVNKDAALPLGVAMGVSIGTAIGVATDNIGLWLSLGVAIGAGLGAAMMASAQQQGTEGNEIDRDEAERTDQN